jgi:CheY-like chemotaxis protein
MLQMLKPSTPYAPTALKTKPPTTAPTTPRTMSRMVPDVMLLDLSMPRMDGYELLAPIRTSTRLRHIPAVAVTAHAFAADKKRCFVAGFADHITKPVEMPILIAVIRSLLAKT